MVNPIFIKRLNQCAYTMLLVMGLLGLSMVKANTLTVPAITKNAIANVQQSQQQRTQAASWGLQVQDYQHYQWLMQHTPSGHWYKSLDPAEVLALNANTPKAMMKYANIQARNMHVRVTRELAFNRLYRKAYKTLYPHEKPIASSIGHQSLQTMNIKPGDRVWLFTKLNTPLGQFAANDLLKVIHNVAKAKLDIYFVGTTINKTRITTWAKRVGITPIMVNHVVTLNVGNSRFKTIAQGKVVHLPFVGVLHNHHFQPISLNSVI